MPRQKKREPREFVLENGLYPWGPFLDETPDDVLAAACFARNLIIFMDGQPREADGDVILGGKENQLSLAKKSGISQGVISRVLSGRSYPDMSTVSNLETFVRGRLWCLPEERYRPFRLD